jgi:hypothetical protein
MCFIMRVADGIDGTADHNHQPTVGHQSRKLLILLHNQQSVAMWADVSLPGPPRPRRTKLA